MTAADSTPRLAVVINHWGGVPAALQPNLVASQPWAVTCISDAHLPHLHPILSFRSVAATSGETLDGMCLDAAAPAPVLPLFDALPRNEVQTIVLGPTGLRRPPKEMRHAGDALPDPREALHEWGVDRCSSVDPSTTTTMALVHDEETLLEARRILMEESHRDRPLLLWVNLLSCRDTTRCRFRTPTANATSVPGYTPRSISAPRDVDVRKVPAAIAARLDDGVSELAMSQDAASFGERPAPTTSAEYLRLLDDSRETWSTSARAPTCWSTRRWTRGRASRCSDARRASRRARARSRPPTHTGATGFFCCSDALALPQSVALHAIVDAFLEHVFQAMPSTSPARATLGVLNDPEAGGRTVVARSVCSLNDHRYACIATWPALDATASLVRLRPVHITHVFDLDTDPDELTNALGDLPHVLAALLEHMEATLPLSVCVPRVLRLLRRLGRPHTRPRPRLSSTAAAALSRARAARRGRHTPHKIRPPQSIPRLSPSPSPNKPPSVRRQRPRSQSKRHGQRRI